MNKSSVGVSQSKSVRAAAGAGKVGSASRSRILSVALKLFAEQGFKKTSIRDIAKLSACNVGAVSYYFGDKQGLYRAAFTEPLNDAGCDVGLVLEGPLAGQYRPHGGQIDAANLQEGLRLFFSSFLAPLARGDEMRQVMKLHFREMLEPTGLWNEAIENEIEPEHQLMLKILTKELGLKRADLDLQRLALSMIGMAVHFFVGQDIVAKLAPAVLATPKSIEVLAERLAMYGSAMIAAEKLRRQSA